MLAEREAPARPQDDAAESEQPVVAPETARDRAALTGLLAGLRRIRPRLPDAAPSSARSSTALAATLITLGAVPFALATADGAAPGLSGVPSPRVWDEIGRAAELLRLGSGTWFRDSGPASPLWSLVIAVVGLPLGVVGVSPAAVAKVLGLVLGALGALSLARIASSTLRTRWSGGLVLALLALDPVLAYGRFAGGSAPLFFALSVGCVAALLEGRYRRLAVLLALAALARPEGILLALLVVTVVAVEALWRRGTLAARGEAVVAGVVGLFTPAAAVYGAWSLHGLIAGDLGASTEAALPLRSALSAVWVSWLGPHPAFDSLFYLFTGVAWLGAGWLLVNRWGVRGMVPWLAPLVPLAALVASPRLPAAGWSYDVRQLGEPALPWFALALGLGLAYAGERIGDSLAPRLRIARSRLVGRALGLMPLSLWLLTGLLLWVRLPTDFAFGARNVAEGPAALGAWAADALPAAAVLGLEPGTEPVRALARKPTRAMAASPDEGAREKARMDGITHVVAYKGSPYAAWPQARELARSSTSRNVALPNAELSLYRMDWEAPKLDPAPPRRFALNGYSTVDALDVGDPASEAGHFYSSAGPGVRVTTESVVAGGWIADDGRAQDAQRGAESFTMAARPGRDLLLAARYDGALRGALRVELEGRAFELPLRECAAALCEDAVLLPGDLVRTGSIRLSVGFGGASTFGGGSRVATHRYWTITKD